MKTYTCTCGQTLFFENSRCLKCDAEVGFCPPCASIVPLILEADGRAYRCGNPSCGHLLRKCANNEEFNVCNRYVPISDSSVHGKAYCDCCRYNQTVPDLSVPGNWAKWYRLESAKRRLFYDLDLLQLPHGTAADGFTPPLSFDFKADIIPVDDFWRRMGLGERVYTGHVNGKITINIREADEVERERLRVDMGEAHRTLIGHFRHEIGHYYWELLVQPQHLFAFIPLFGDPYTPDYSTAMNRYYRDGAPANWAETYVSAYAAMHPWEDWAETFAAYLDMVSALETAVQMDLMEGPWYSSDMDRMVTQYQKLGVGLNEMSRTLGLLDMVPDVFVPAVVEKMRLVHQVCAGPSKQS